MNYKQMISKIERQKNAIGKERDKLDDLISELANLKDDCDQAYDLLEEARDALSRLV